MKYKCSRCDASNCKLWRQYNTLLDYIELMCAKCACKAEDKDVSTMNADGRRMDEYGSTDQIGMMIPAVPSGDTFWGYTSVPQDGVDWWKALPSLPEDND